MMLLLHSTESGYACMHAGTFVPLQARRVAHEKKKQSSRAERRTTGSPGMCDSWMDVESSSSTTCTHLCHPMLLTDGLTDGSDLGQPALPSALKL
jgi:hypothetical protein